MMKKFIALMLAILCVFSLVACGENPYDQNDDKGNDNVNDNTQTYEGGIKLTDRFSFVSRSDNKKIKDEAKLEAVSTINSRYCTTESGKVFVDYTAPCFELGGIIAPHRNGKTVSRLDVSMLERFKTELVNGEDIVNDYSLYTSGATLRFCTSATKITIKAKFTDEYKSKGSAVRSTLGMDVFVGAGTEKVHSQGQSLLVANNMETEISLGAGNKEVLICLPQGAKLSSFSIGFAKNDKVGLPLKRDHAPIVFYGSDMTQGIGSIKPATAYTNLVCRMLNTDCINQGYIDGAHGEQVMADYIASKNMSAFVMEFDHGATLEELKANHYNFYKTVRDAHPDIPIVIMSNPVFSDAALEASKERVAVIKETFTKAVEAGDDNVYFLDGSKMFPMTDVADIYTTDMKTPNDLGMYHIAMCVYDILNSAFTPDSEKSGTDRLPGLLDTIDFTPKASGEKVEDATYTKVSDINSKYVSTTKDGNTFLKYSTPQFEIGGINDPADNKGMFYRIDYSNMNAYKKEIYDSGLWSHAAYNTTGGTLRFRTNATALTIKATMQNASSHYQHISTQGSAGFDVYVGTGTDRVLCRTEGQLIADYTKVEETVTLPGGYVEVMIVFPSYGGIKSLEIGLPSDAEIAEPTERSMGTICFYGSSVTHGACPSRPGMTFANLVTRMLDADCKNLGFSGTGRGEPIIAKYVAEQEMDLLVMEYNPNSPIPELRQNHYNFYKTIRDAQPDLPIVIISNPYYDVQPNSDMSERLSILKDTYNKAIAAGDKNVYYIDPSEYFPKKELADLCAVDKLHPTDIGMYYMAKAIYNQLVEILGK